MKRFFLVLFSALFFPAMASAQTAPDVKSALASWVKAVQGGSVEDIVSLYDKDAVMLSAFAIEPLTSHEQLKQYYAKVVKEPNRNVDVTKQDVRQFGNVATNTGLYVFHYEQEGEQVEIPARFTFVYTLKNGKWMIISHHSSRVPGAAKNKEEQK